MPRPKSPAPSPVLDPVTKKPIKRWKWPGVPGSVEFRNGWCRSRIGRHLTSHGRGISVALDLRAEAKNEAKAKKLHTKLARQHSDLKVTRKAMTQHGIAAAPAARKVSTVREAINRFAVVRNFPARSLKAQKMWRKLFREVFPSFDMVITDEHIELVISRWLSAPRTKALAANTFIGERLRVNSFLNWCRRSGRITRNPLDEEKKPKKPKKIVIVYTPEEITRIDAWWARQQEWEHDHVTSPTRRNAYAYRLLWRVLEHSGMRISEALSLRRRSHITDPDTENHVTETVIALRQTKTDPRMLPYRQLPELAGAIDDALALPATCKRLRHGYLFPMSDDSTVGKAWKRMVASLASDPDDPITIDGGNRYIHAWRSTCNARLKALHWPKDARLAWLGHSDDVNEEHYDAELPAELLAEQIEIARRARQLLEESSLDESSSDDATSVEGVLRTTNGQHSVGAGRGRSGRSTEKASRNPRK